MQANGKTAQGVPKNMGIISDDFDVNHFFSLFRKDC